MLVTNTRIYTPIPWVKKARYSFQEEYIYFFFLAGVNLCVCVLESLSAIIVFFCVILDIYPM